MSSHKVKANFQFQLTVNVTAVALAMVSAIASPTEQSALTAVQLLWVNLIMDTFAALALATDPPTLELLDRKPEPKNASIITFNMWKMIFGQAILQLVITFILNFGGTSIFTSWDAASMQTVTFNTFVWLQIFNEVNCRRLDHKLNVFSGIQRNPFFIGITLIMIVGQIIIIFVGGAAFTITHINGAQWALSIVLGLLSLPFGVIIRLIPNDFIKIFIPRRLLEKKRKTTIVDEERVTEEWNPAIEGVRDDLIFIKRLRSRRRLGTIGNPKKAIRRFIPSKDSKEKDDSSSYRRPSTLGERNSPPSPSPSPSSRKRQRSRANSGVLSAAMVPGLVATSMMWSPVSPATEGRSSEFPITMSREDLEKVEGVELHKDTDPNDPIIGEEAAIFSPLEDRRPGSSKEHSDKGEGSSKSGHWRGRLSFHSRAASRGSAGSSPAGSHSPTIGLPVPRRDVSQESRSSTKNLATENSSSSQEDKKE
jgi:P-type Ca2+ transporter type 2C